MEQASILQVQYYLYYLEKKGLTGIKGVLDYPLLKQKVEVELTWIDRKHLDEILSKIELIMELDIPPDIEKKSICKKCAYFDLCFV